MRATTASTSGPGASGSTNAVWVPAVNRFLLLSTAVESPRAATPDASGIDPAAWVARVEPFAVESGGQFLSKGPRDLESGAYAKEYDEVKALGGATSVLPQPLQDVRDFFTGNPVEMFNRSLRAHALSEGLDLSKQARLFALMGLSGADAFITCWQDKSKWSFWRPQTAIQLGDSDGNEKTAGDGNWTSWAANPPYPDQSSGYNCITGALMQVAEAFFGRGDTSFTVAKTAGGPTRTYRHFRDVYQDTIDARIYQGLHFRTADEAGAQIGEDVAEWVAKHSLTPAR